ncbi:MAG TPA: 3-hydroxyacyl-CoA dehydrogenase NAD-binding domain-containing protein [Anaeromyxobacteraceae bacterium]|nr:3-hydroxyacyl-CoA dehydrogenase NAD-binding domain-containing protein [Anaeromyxobacteraceae bacterium]
MASPPGLQTVAVIGAGDLGNGVARLAALGGLHVRLYDRSIDSLRKAMDYIRQGVQEAVARGHLSSAGRQGILDGLFATGDLEEAVVGTELVLDAAPDLLPLKRQLFAEIGRCNTESTLATLSTLPLSVIAQAAPRPGQVVGLRFAEPMDESSRMEIVSLAATELSAVERARLFAARIGRRAVVLRDRWAP